jgi:hypothetical protein
MSVQVRSIALVALAAAGARADVVSLSSVGDATLWNDPSGATANGSGPVMVAGRAGATASAPIRRALVRFDVASAIPPGSTITSAKLVLSFTSGNAGAHTVELHRVLASWSEGASSTTSGQGAPAQPGDATWLHRAHPTLLWNTPGADFSAAASSAQLVTSFGTVTWPTTAAAELDVQTWLDDPASNHGWLIKRDSESSSNTTMVFGTREATDPLQRPQLLLEFDPPPVFAYCTSQLSSLGCSPTIGWSGTASATSGAPFTITLTDAVNQRGALLSYGTSGPAAVPFLGGLLCIAAPVRRVAFASTSGNLGIDDCSGARAFDFNAWTLAGVDPTLVAGADVCAQWLTRDPTNPAGSFGSSDALRFVVAP